MKKLLADTEKQKILIVDDAPSNIKMLIEMFASDYEIAVAINGETALRATKTCRPDLILLDVEMPNLDGYEVCVRLKADPDTQAIPIIFLTARNDDLNEAKGLQLGAIDYITKPFCPEVAIARVRNHLALKRHRDATERMMNALREAREFAEQASRFKGEFLSNMSHEIRTPMNAIIGLADLAMNLEMSPKLRNYLGKIASSSQSLLRIINDILDFSKIEAGKLELEMSNFFLREVFDHLTNIFREPTNEKRIELIFCAAEECRYELFGDSLRLEQVLMNLISNALKFTEEGEIEVQVRTIQESANQVTLKFSVRDTGIGMTDEYKNKLFQPFTQADTSVTRKFGGTGLGLSISKRLVELMGGRIWIDSQCRRGSMFYFTVVFQRKLDTVIDDMMPPEDMERIKILVVDDNDAARNSIRTLLGMFNFLATGVGSGPEAVNAIKQSIIEGNPYRLILMDWFMPTMDGIQTLRQIKETILPELFPKTILLINSEQDTKLHTLGDVVGVNAYLTKPVNCSLLFDTIMNIFGKNIAKSFVNKNSTIIDTKKIMERIGGANVLLVEDNAINQQVAREILEDIGVVVEVANNGLEAITKVMESMYDIVLMDIQMPEMDGYQASRQIRNDPKFNKLPIIAMTANAMTGDREKCLHFGMNEHISKPINKSRLYTVLMEWIVPRKGLGLLSLPMRNKNLENNELQLPESIPGIDVNIALERLNGNRRLYYSLLLDFHRDYAQAGQQMRSFLTGMRKDDSKSAAALAHTIKGLAGNISAIRLFDAASNLEHAIKYSPEKHLNMLEIFESALSEVVEAIETIKQCKDEAAPIISDQELISSVKASSLDMKNITFLMVELFQQLKQKVYKSQKSFEKLKPYLTHAPEEAHQEVKRLEELIERIDFKGAQHSLRSLAKIFAIDLEAK
ncbi:two-component system, sensor histidine kinase and response regulator [Gammaproteobacteria bacterium]